MTKSVYANPEKPSICPILMLGIHLLSLVHQLEPSFSLFDGAKEEINFSNWLRKKLEGMTIDESTSLGLERDLLQ